MRNTFLVCYDIRDDKRLRKVFKTMRDFGDHLQYSIFECQFTAIDLARCRHALSEIIKHNGSLVGICLPDETWSCRMGNGAADATSEPAGSAAGGQQPQLVSSPRRLVPARDDLRPLYLNKQGLHVGKSGNVLKIKEKGKVVQEVRVGETCQVNVFGNIQLSTQAVQTLCGNEVPIAYFSMGGWFYGVQRMDTLVTHPLFGYRVNYRRMLEIQSRLLARLLTGEIESYPVFVTR